MQSFTKIDFDTSWAFLCVENFFLLSRMRELCDAQKIK